MVEHLTGDRRVASLAESLYRVIEQDTISTA